MFAKPSSVYPPDYCKVDVVPTYVLISGVVAQNRAIEGDIVAIVVDPPSLWPKMKGSNETLNESACRASCSEQSEALMLCRGSSKGKSKLELDFEHACSVDYLGFSEDGTCYETGSSSAAMADNRFDTAGAGACLKRYIDPSFVKTETSSIKMNGTYIQREKKIRKAKLVELGLHKRSGGTGPRFVTLREVAYKHQLELDEKNKKALDKQLEFLLGQTDLELMQGFSATSKERSC